MRPFLLIIALATLSCGYFTDRQEPRDVESDDRVMELREKFDERMGSLRGLSTGSGHWPSDHDCDSLLWAAEASMAGAEIDLHLAEGEPGQWFRTPDHLCFDEGRSKSDISRDMLSGLLGALWVRRDLAGLQRLGAYGEEHNWIMGRGPSSRTLMTPNLQGLLGRMIYALSDGEDDRSYRHLPAAFLPVKEDYERHIQALLIFLQGRVHEALRTGALVHDGGRHLLVDLSEFELEALERLSSAEPENAFYHAALGLYSGSFDRALSLLLSDSTPTPSYVRGEALEAFTLAHWLFTASIVLEGLNG